MNVHICFQACSIDVEASSRRVELETKDLSYSSSVFLSCSWYRILQIITMAALERRLATVQVSVLIVPFSGNYGTGRGDILVNCMHFPAG